MKPDNFLAAYIVFIAIMLLIAYGVHEAHSQEIHPDEMAEYLYWHRLGMLEAAHDEKTDYPPLLPAEHDKRFWLPESEWRKQYCKRHEAKSCDPEKR